jgi:AcrR family transcriptional regulator
MKKRDPDGTREKILRAAFREIHRSGFRSASIDQILAETGLTKGALYHHFPNKNALGYAVVDEVIRDLILEAWVKPMEGSPDPVTGVKRVLEKLSEEKIRTACECGCPLNNLAQEMSPLDEGFRRRIKSLLDFWRDRTAEALLRGQGAGLVRADIDCRKAASFIVASIEGAAGMTKNAQDPSMLDACFEGLLQYLESLRTPVPATTA